MNVAVNHANRQRVSEELFVVFRLAGEEYAAPVVQIREVIKLVPITKIPQCADFVEGMINIRGIVIPIVNLKQRLGLGSEVEKNGKILVVELQESSIGLIVDNVDEVLRIRKEDVQPAPRLASAVSNHYIEGVAYHKDKMVILLGLERIFSEAEQVDLLMLT